jgi:hypothetical protein
MGIGHVIDMTQSMLANKLPNYDNPTTRGNGTFIAQGIFAGVGTVVLLLRMYSRLRIVKATGASDALIIIAWVSNHIYPNLSLICGF